jgi:hypothetical protein
MDDCQCATRAGLNAVEREGISLPPYRLEPTFIDRPARSPVAILTELYIEMSALYVTWHFKYKWFASFRFQKYYPRGKSLQCPLVKMLGGPHSQKGRAISPFFLMKPRFFGRPARSLTSIPNELCIKLSAEYMIHCTCIRFDLFEFRNISVTAADHSGMKRLAPLEHWDRGFESHSRHGCLRLCCPV